MSASVKTTAIFPDFSVTKKRRSTFKRSSSFAMSHPFDNFRSTIPEQQYRPARKGKRKCASKLFSNIADNLLRNRRHALAIYLASRTCELLVPIRLNVVMISPEFVSAQYIAGLLAQFCRTDEATDITKTVKIWIFDAFMLSHTACVRASMREAL